MSDIQRNDTHDLVLRDNGLKKKHLAIIISEKKNQIRQLDVTLDKMKTVDFKKIELTKETYEKEIQALTTELKRMDAINVGK